MVEQAALEMGTVIREGRRGSEGDEGGAPFGQGAIKISI
jgi:hypothetical protein